MHVPFLECDFIEINLPGPAGTTTLGQNTPNAIRPFPNIPLADADWTEAKRKRTMNFAQRISVMVAAVERADAESVAACFTPNGIYHDVFYGDFEGRPAIADMISHRFYRDASEFRWDIHDAIENNQIGYARYVFSYLPKGQAGQTTTRTMFEGVAICRMQDGLIADYREIANAATGLHGMGFAPERIAKFVGKQAAELSARAESLRHIS